MITRRAILLGLAAAGFAPAADPASEVWNLLTSMASALAEADAAAFLSAIDSSMPGYDAFRAAVLGLLNEVTVNSSINPVQNTGDDRARTLEVDWSMHLVDANGVEEVTPREANVKIGFARRRGKWKVTSFEPADFFRPPAGGGLPKG